jgi:LmbE family N-acetylglucosaminyl deacetylase
VGGGVNVTALLAHPDDELMCAGTLARLVDEGHGVRLITAFFSDFGPDHHQQGLREERLSELAASAKVLGVDLVAECEPDEAALAWSQAWVQRFERLVQEVPPDLLIGHRVMDPNTSHGHLGRLARTLARKNRLSLWEVDQAIPGGLEPDAGAPNHLVDVSAQYPHKSQAVACYASQLQRYPGMDEAIEHRDRYYGWLAGVSCAEVFHIVKSVWL